MSKTFVVDGDCCALMLGEDVNAVVKEVRCLVENGAALCAFFCPVTAVAD